MFSGMRSTWIKVTVFTIIQALLLCNVTMAQGEVFAPKSQDCLSPTLSLNNNQIQEIFIKQPDLNLDIDFSSKIDEFSNTLVKKLLRHEATQLIQPYNAKGIADNPRYAKSQDDRNMMFNALISIIEKYLAYSKADTEQDRNNRFEKLREMIPAEVVEDEDVIEQARFITASSIWLLGQIGELKATRYLIEQLQTEDPNIALETVRALGNLLNVDTINGEKEDILKTLKELKKKYSSGLIREELNYMLKTVQDKGQPNQSYLDGRRKRLRNIQKSKDGQKKKEKLMTELFEFELTHLIHEGHFILMNEQGDQIKDVSRIMQVIKQEIQVILGIPSYGEGQIKEFEDTPGEKVLEHEIGRSIRAAEEGLNKYVQGTVSKKKFNEVIQNRQQRKILSKRLFKNPSKRNLLFQKNAKSVIKSLKGISDSQRAELLRLAHQFTPEGKSTLFVNMSHQIDKNTKSAFIQAVKKKVQEKGNSKKKNSAKSYYLHVISKPLGKGNNFLNLFRVASLAKNLEASIVVDADLRNITQQWITSLAKGILSGEADYVTPIYDRHWSDGSITHHLAKNVLRFLGWTVAQPIGGEFSFGPEFLKAVMDMYVSEEGWPKEAFTYGIDIFMTISAFGKELKVRQIDLKSKVHAPSKEKLNEMSRQVFYSAISMFLKYEKFITLNGGISKSEIIPTDIINNEKAQDLKVDYESFRGVKLNFLNEINIKLEENDEFLRELLINDKDNYNRLIKAKENFEKIRNLEESDIKKKLQHILTEDLVTHELWIDILIDSIVAFKKAKTEGRKDRIVETLRAVYFGRVSTVMHEALRTWHENYREGMSEKEIAEIKQVMSDRANVRFKATGHYATDERITLKRRLKDANDELKGKSTESKVKGKALNPMSVNIKDYAVNKKLVEKSI